MELVTTFSDETKWSIISTGLLVVLVGMMVVSNRSSRRNRPLLIIFIVDAVRPPLPGRRALLTSRDGVKQTFVLPKGGNCR